MNSLLPIYNEGIKKSYQLPGNKMTYELDLNQQKGDILPNFFTEWIKYDKFTSSNPQPASFTLYSLNKDRLKYASEYDEFTPLRTVHLSLGTSNITRESTTVGTDVYYRFYLSGTRYYPSFVENGVYELVFVAGGLTFESEIFSTCMLNADNISRLVCGTVTLPAINYGSTPTLTIPVSETGGAAGLAEVTVTWSISRAGTFPYIFPFVIFGTTLTDVTETQSYTVSALGSHNFVFTIPDILPTGSYTVTYTSNIPGCNGIKTLAVNSPWFEITSGGWPVSVDYGWQNVRFDLVVSNTDDNTRMLHITLMKDAGTPYEVTENNIEVLISGLSSTTITRFYNINTAISHIMQVIGDVNATYILDAVSPT